MKTSRQDAQQSFPVEPNTLVETAELLDEQGDGIATFVDATAQPSSSPSALLLVDEAPGKFPGKDAFFTTIEKPKQTIAEEVLRLPVSRSPYHTLLVTLTTCSLLASLLLFLWPASSPSMLSITVIPKAATLSINGTLYRDIPTEIPTISGETSITVTWESCKPWILKPTLPIGLAQLILRRPQTLCP